MKRILLFVCYIVRALFCLFVVWVRRVVLKWRFDVISFPWSGRLPPWCQPADHWLCFSFGFYPSYSRQLCRVVPIQLNITIHIIFNKSWPLLLTPFRKLVPSVSILSMMHTLLGYSNKVQSENNPKTHREHFHTHLSSSLNCHQSIATNDSIPSWEKNPETPRFSLCRGT